MIASPSFMKFSRRGFLAAAFCSAVAPSRALSRQVRLSELGVPVSTGDMQSRLEAAFATARADGLKIVASPHETYRHSGLLDINGFELDAQDAHFVATDETHSRIRLTGNRPVLRNIRRSSPNAAVRLSPKEAKMVLVEDATDAVIDRIRIDGGASSGIFCVRVNGLRASRTVVSRTLSDAFHCTNGSMRVRAYDHKAIDCGDDSFAVVSYGGQDKICEDIVATRVHSIRSPARGLAVVGGRNVRFENCVVEESAYAAFYVASEKAYDTYGVSDVAVVGGAVRNSVTRPGTGHAAIYLRGRAGSKLEPATGNRIPNAVVGVSIWPPSFSGMEERGVKTIRSGVFCRRVRIFDPPSA